MRRTALADFLRAESSGGVVLLLTTVIALVWASSPYDGAYRSVFDGGVRHVVNDGLMAVFFLVVGLEIKREVVAGELRDRRVAALPVIAAIGGMAVPALVYLAVNAGGDLRGWAVPTATDVAFTVAILTALGSRVPPALKVFVLALAIVDDIGAVLVIALFYGGRVEVMSLLAAIGLLAVYAGLHRLRRVPWPAYVVVAVLCWAALSGSGVHPTLAGAAIGLLTPVAAGERAERVLHPWSAFVVVPVFALANAGVALSAGAFHDAITDRVAIGIALGLVFGKPVGIVVATWLAVRAGWGRLPTGASWRQVHGAAQLCGIGFTVSLFVTGLAFVAPSTARGATVAVLLGSVVSATLGAMLLRAGARQSA
jgi:NhaA family Na+:H+ antiporter